MYFPILSIHLTMAGGERRALTLDPRRQKRRNVEYRKQFRSISGRRFPALFGASVFRSQVDSNARVFQSHIASSRRPKIVCQRSRISSAKIGIFDRNSAYGIFFRRDSLNPVPVSSRSLRFPVGQIWRNEKEVRAAS